MLMEQQDIKRRDVRKFIILFIAIIINLLGGLSAHHVSASEPTSTAELPQETVGESYVIGLDDTFAPMGFRDDNGDLVGFDVDLANAMADLYDWNLDFQAIDWSLKETELNSGNIDMIWNGYGITPEREEQVLFSEPYYMSSQLVVSQAGSGIDELEDLEGKTIATQSGSTALSFMENWPNDLYNRLAEEPVLYPDYNQVFSDLDAGRVDSLYVGEVYGLYVMNLRGSDQYDYFVDETSTEPMGVGMRFEDEELKEALDAGFQRLKENGTYDQISSKWFGNTEEGGGGEEEPLLQRIMPSLLNGLKLTVGIFAFVLVVSIPLGFVVAIIRVFGPGWLKAVIEAYVFVMRGTPLMLQLMVVFFGLPFAGITMGRMTAALFAFVINYTAYFAEIFRGGISSVPRGQYESISVLGIGKFRGFYRVILPQVMKIVMPSVGNEVISLIKDTSLVYVIGIGELLRAGSIASNTYASLIPYLAVGVLYLILTGILTVVLKKTEQSLKW